MKRTIWVSRDKAPHGSVKSISFSSNKPTLRGSVFIGSENIISCRYARVKEFEAVFGVILREGECKKLIVEVSHENEKN